MKSISIKQLFPLLFVAMFLCFPSLCFSGASNGWNLFLYTIVPSLFPFLVFSNLILKTSLLESLCNLIYPFFRPIFQTSRLGCFPILIGLFSGYPMGAKYSADLVKTQSISLDEGQYLLSFVNNASPMFLSYYISTHCLHKPQCSLVFLFLTILSSFIISLFYRKIILKTSFMTTTLPKEKKCSSFSCFPIDKSIHDAFETLIKIGSYIMLCSIVSAFLLSVPNIIAPLGFLLSCLTEITTGAQIINQTSFLSDDVKIILTLATVTFGGLSSLFQTFSVIAGSGLSIIKYIIAKLCQTIVFVLLLTVYLILFL